MRNDFEGSMQLTGKFATEEEKQSWKNDEKDISNITHPFSGSERNRLFVNSHADSFLDLSGISGVDSASDGRVSVWLDIDRDGRQDLAVVNSNRPLLQLYRNQTGAAARKSAPTANDSGNFVAVRFVGGHNSAEPTQKLSNRDGWGVRVTLRAGGQTITREHLCGQGFSGQNSATMLIGLGKADIIESLTVAWPSGVKQDYAELPTGKLVTFHEHPPSQSPQSLTAPGMTVASYDAVPLKSPSITEPLVEVASRNSIPGLVRLAAETAAGTARNDTTRRDSQLIVITTMASWCTSCARHQPLLKAMADPTNGCFGMGEVSFVGVAGDPEDAVDDLDRFIHDLDIDYPVIVDPDPTLRAEVESILETGDGADILPSTIVLDRHGRIVGTHSGIPTVSELRQLKSALSSGAAK